MSSADLTPDELAFARECAATFKGQAAAQNEVPISFLALIYSGRDRSGNNLATEVSRTRRGWVVRYGVHMRDRRRCASAEIYATREGAMAAALRLEGDVPPANFGRTAADLWSIMTDEERRECVGAARQRSMPAHLDHYRRSRFELWRPILADWRLSRPRPLSDQQWTDAWRAICRHYDEWGNL